MSTSGGVLGSSTSDKLCGIVVQEVLIDLQVLLLSENGIISLEAILLEESIVPRSLDIYVLSVSLEKRWD